MVDRITTRAQEAVAQLAEELEHAERLVEEQTHRIDALGSVRPALGTMQ